MYYDTVLFEGHIFYEQSFKDFRDIISHEMLAFKNQASTGAG